MSLVRNRLCRGRLEPIGGELEFLEQEARRDGAANERPGTLAARALPVAGRYPVHMRDDDLQLRGERSLGLRYLPRQASQPMNHSACATVRLVRDYGSQSCFCQGAVGWYCQ